MGAEYSKEVDADIQESVDTFVSKCLHRTQDHVYTKVSDVVQTARRMLKDIDEETISVALLNSLGTRFIRYTMKDDEAVADIILNHKLLDMDIPHEAQKGDDFFEVVEPNED